MGAPAAALGMKWLAACSQRRYRERMSAAVAEKRRWTVEEYLALERDSPDKHEFFDGEVFAMAGVSPEHDQIVSNLITALNLAFRGKCRVFTADMRLSITATNKYTYADASLVCGDPSFTSDRPPALTNPQVIFEVLSESTERYDRGKKFEHYRSISSLTDYVLVAQDQVLVECFRKQAGGWLYTSLADGQLILPCGPIAIADLYL